MLLKKRSPESYIYTTRMDIDTIGSVGGVGMLHVKIQKKDYL